MREQVWKNGHDLLELEWRVGHALGQFRAGVDGDAWQRLKTQLESSPAFVASFVETHETLGNHGVRRVCDPQGQVTAWIRKQKLGCVDEAQEGGPWTIRSSVSIDVPCAPPPPTDPFVPQYERHKRRWSFRHACWSVDLTIARGNTPTCLDSDADVYEVEVELVDRDMLLERPLPHIVEWGRKVASDVCGLMVAKSSLAV